MNTRRILVAAGLVLFALSVLELAQPGLSPLPRNDVLLTAVGAAALLYAVTAGYRRRRTGPENIETPDVELAEPTAVPGTDLEETVTGFPSAESVYGGPVPTIQDGLRNAATAVLARYRGLDTETAREQVATGSWTDDPHAAEFLSEGSTAPSLRQRLRSLVAFESYRERALANTVDAVAAVAGVEPADEVDDDTDDPVEVTTETGTKHRVGQSGTRQPTNHWTGVSVVVLACLAAGLLLEQAGVLLAGVVAVGYAAYARSTPQGPVELSAARSVSDTTPDPGDEVEVELTITNEGGFCPDLRIVDGVPEPLVVSGGSPRRAVSLRSGESATLTYSVVVRQGTHEFGPAMVVARNLSGSTETELLVSAETALSAVPALQPVQESVPLRKKPTQYAGQAPTDSGGEGLEFRTVREYHPGDSMTRIDWNRRARTGELTTIEFQRERATRIALLIDVRPESYVGHEPTARDAVERSIDATQRLFPALLADGHQVGLGAFGPQECFLAPDSGVSHRKRGRELLATDPAFNARTEPNLERRNWVPRLRQQLPDNTQLVICSPVLDAPIVRLIREFEVYGYPTTVISPDPTANTTPSERLMRARRRLMLSDLRQAGVRVLDWAPDESLEEILKREALVR